MNNEPVAIRYDFDGYGYQYMDSGSGSDWQTRVDGELLYAHPAKELTERIRKLETALQGWEIGFERMGYERLLKDKDEYIAELLKESAKELTDDEVADLVKASVAEQRAMGEARLFFFAKILLKKAQEK